MYDDDLDGGYEGGVSDSRDASRLEESVMDVTVPEEPPVETTPRSPSPTLVDDLADTPKRADDVENKYTIDGTLLKMPRTRTNAPNPVHFPNRFQCKSGECARRFDSLTDIKSHLLRDHPTMALLFCVDLRAKQLRKKSRVFFCKEEHCRAFFKKEEELFIHHCSEEDMKGPADPESMSIHSIGEEASPASAMTGDGEMAVSAPFSSGKSRARSSETPVSRALHRRSSRSHSQNSPKRTTDERESGSDTEDNQRQGEEDGDRVYQCSHCMYISTRRDNIVTHCVDEHECKEGGFTEIESGFSQDGRLVVSINEKSDGQADKNKNMKTDSDTEDTSDNKSGYVNGNNTHRGKKRPRESSTESSESDPNKRHKSDDGPREARPATPELPKMDNKSAYRDKRQSDEESSEEEKSDSDDESDAIPRKEDEKEEAGTDSSSSEAESGDDEEEEEEEEENKSDDYEESDKQSESEKSEEQKSEQDNEQSDGNASKSESEEEQSDNEKEKETEMNGEDRERETDKAEKSGSGEEKSGKSKRDDGHTDSSSTYSSSSSPTSEDEESSS